MTMIYKICPAPLWREAEAAGALIGLPIDMQDGYIHFSTAAQLGETLRLHFAGDGGLVVAAVDAAALQGDLRWEKSRGGEFFPHLYGSPLALADVAWVKPLPLGPDGRHVLPNPLP